MSAERYRIDRVPQGTETTPKGMDTVIAISSERRWIEKDFQCAAVGLEPDGRPNPSYGVILSQWDGHQYSIQDRKFPK